MCIRGIEGENEPADCHGKSGTHNDIQHTSLPCQEIAARPVQEQSKAITNEIQGICRGIDSCGLMSDMLNG